MRFLSVFFLLIFFTNLYSQDDVIVKRTSPINNNLTLNSNNLRVTPIPSSQQAVENLIKDDLLGGGCIEIRNVNGSSALVGTTFAQIGRFQKDDNLDIGFEKGIILSTGNVRDAQGPNSAHTNTTDADTDFGNDSNPDVAFIEFEFRPTGDSIAFNYVFASEEYPEFVCQFNDEFSFEIRKAGTTDPLENLALIPGTTDPVTINNVNDQFGILSCVTTDRSTIYNDNPLNSPILRYDGFTNVFTASKGQLDPCEWYYFRMEIGDRGDGSVDSAVFLEGNSFSDGSPVTIDPIGTVPGTGDAIEGCKDGFFLFGRGPNNDPAFPYTIDFTISGTATEGTDYQNLVRSVTIPAGQDTLHLNVYPIVDVDNAEGDETIILETTNINCGCSTLPIISTVILKEYDQTITTLPIEICQGQSHTLPDGSTMVNMAGSYETILPRVADPLCDSIIVTNLTVNPLPVANPAELRECSDTNMADFNLTLADATVGNGAAGMNITYHASQANADTGVAPLLSPYNSANITIYARVENQTSFCVSTNEVDLFVDANPIANPIADWIECDTDNNNSFDFNLSTRNPEILGTQPSADYAITYHASQTAADDGTGALPTIYSSVSNSEQIFARIENNTTFCYATTSFEIEVFDTPIANTPVDWQECDTNNDGLFDFDLTTRDAAVLNGQSATDFTVSYHDSQAHADAGSNALSSPHTNVGNPQPIFIRIENNLRTNCYNTTSFDIEVNNSPAIQTPPKWNQCDNDNNGSFSFDLSTQDATVLGGLSATDYTVSYFDTEAKADANTGAITNPYANTSNPETIWIRLHNNANITCYAKASFEIEVFDQPSANTPAKWDVCDNDNNGEFLFDFTSRDSEVLNGQPAGDFMITYHELETEADAGTDVLNGAYTNTSNPQTIWVRIENNSNSTCYDKASFEIEVFDSPTAGRPAKWNVCDNDNDGISVFDFTLKDSEVLDGQSAATYAVKYYHSESDADGDDGEITATYTNVNNRETIWARIENINNQTCFDTVSFEIEVFNTPNAVDVPINIPTCSANANAIFDLTAVALSVADNVSGMDVNFYSTMADAQAQVNVIATPAAYSSPTDIVFAVVSDPTNNNCSDIGEVQLTVLNNPAVRNQTITECEQENIALESLFDLTSVESDIINNAQNVTITYHESLVDANSGAAAISNPTNYQSIAKTVFARSLANYNGTFCHSVSEIVLNINLLPEAIDDVYVLCSSQTTAAFDLTSRIPIITGGQASAVTFFETENDARANTPSAIITSPFTTNPVTIWARVLDPTTNCLAYAQLELNIILDPEVNETLQITECIRLGQSTFNLLAEKNRLETEYLDYLFTFHALEQEAIDDVNPLPDDLISGASTIYVRIETRNSNCFTIKTMELLVDPIPEDDKGEHIICTANGYTLPNGEQVFAPGDYDRTIQDPITGCDILTKTKLILGDILFPSVFSPNTNSQNDTFRALPGDECAAAVNNFEMNIFNRWGEKVFVSNDYNIGWDGTFNGYTAPVGLYLWFATYEFNGSTVTQNGSVNLIR